MTILGIDLGTTNSLGAVYRNGKVELIPNSLGEYYTPSVVSVTPDGKVVTGAIAREMMITSPRTTVAEFKRDMGLRKRYKLGRKEYYPEELSSFIIRSIVDDAEKYLNEKIENVVISVPAYFYDAQRIATRQAGALAGVNVLRIINEPSAAALSAYVDSLKEEMFLVFDFGGGTLDVSIVDCFGTIVEIMGISGDNNLGGKDIDRLIADSFLFEFGMALDDLSEDECKKILRSAERTKIALTNQNSIPMSMVIDGEDKVVNFTNDKLVEICSPILGRIKKTLEKAFLSSGYTVRDISRVVMAGGSSNMPIVKMFLSMLMKDVPIICGNNEEMIVRGLGNYTGIIQRSGELANYVMTDICPFSIGVGGYNPNDPGNDYMEVFIPKNAILPISNSKAFVPVSKTSRALRLDIFQGESAYTKDNLKLGDMEIKLPVNNRDDLKVRVTLSYDIDGILVVDGVLLPSGKTYHKVLAPNIEDVELKEAVEKLRNIKIDRENVDIVRFIKEKLKSLYAEISQDYQEAILDMIMEYDRILGSGDRIKQMKYEKYLTSVINSFENYDPFNLNNYYDEYESESGVEDNNTEDDID